MGSVHGDVVEEAVSNKYILEILADVAMREWDKSHWLGVWSPGAVSAIGRFPRVVVDRVPPALLALERAPSEVSDLRADEAT